jgi:heme/copper-type cytochrome/quinol oxidase subunit 2
MHNPPKPPTPSLPPEPPKDIPPAAEHAAKLVGWGGWLAFWVQLIAGAVLGVGVIVAIISRTLEEDKRVIWVGLALLFAIASLITLLVSTYLAFGLTRVARRLALPQKKPTPSPQVVSQRVTLALFVSTGGLAVGLLGTGVSALSLLAKALTHPQGAALYSPESTLRVLDVLVILINSGLAAAHFTGQVANYWLLRHKW